MKQISILMFLFGITFALNIQAQTPPAIQWDKTFGGNGSDGLRDIQLTSDGGYILGGGSNSGNNGDKTDGNVGNNDFWIIKLNNAGIKVWDKAYGGTGDDFLYSLQQTTDGGYILGGVSGSGISGDKSQANKGLLDYWVIKVDLNGNKIWDKTFGGNKYDYLVTVQQTPDGGYILGGYSTSDISGDKTQAVSGGNDFWIVKLDSNGNKLWDKTYGGNKLDYFGSLKQTADGGYLLAGNSDSGISGSKTQPSKGGKDFWIVKIDSLGNKQWDKTFGGTDSDGLADVQQTADGGYILGGYSGSNISGDKTAPNKGDLDMWVVKIDVNGTKQWDKAFGGALEEGIIAFRQTMDGGYFLFGSSRSGISGDKTEISRGGYDFWIVKIDGNGNKLWDKGLGGNSYESPQNFQITTDGGYILGGYSDSNISGDKTVANKGGTDFWVVKLAPDLTPTGLTATNFDTGINIYPNPSTGQFYLQFETPQMTQVKIYNMLGQPIIHRSTNINNQEMPMQLDLSKQAKGIYTVQIITGNQTLTRKVIVE